MTGVKGVTSVKNGVTIEAGTPFDWGRKSDFDIGLVSTDLFTEAGLSGLQKMKTLPTGLDRSK